MLLPDPRLLSLRIAWSPQEMARVLNERALPRLCPGAGASDVAIASVTYRPARTCVVLYSVRLAGKQSPLRVLATFGKPGTLERVYRQHYEGGQETSARAVLLRELGCLIELFPADLRVSIARASAT